jgi:hypothetical protein
MDKNLNFFSILNYLILNLQEICKLLKPKPKYQKKLNTLTQTLNPWILCVQTSDNPTRLTPPQTISPATPRN